MHIFQNIVLFFFLSLGNLCLATPLCFYSVSPGKRDACKTNLITNLKAADTGASLHVAMYSLSNIEIINELKSFARTKGNVCIIVDINQYSTSNAMKTRLEDLKRSFPNHVFIRSLGAKKRGREIFSIRTLHDKLSILKNGSNYMVMMGSYNWTYFASKMNYENCLFLKNEGVESIDRTINSAKTRFNNLWALSNDIYGKTPPPPDCLISTAATCKSSLL